MSSARAEHVLNYVSIKRTLVLLEVIDSEDDAIRNIPCPFHNFGRERRPSGKIYDESDERPSGSFYCFTCQKTWDPIGFLMEYKSLGFPQALKWFEGRFNIPPLKVEPLLVKETPALPENRDESELRQTLNYGDALIRRLRGKISFHDFILLCDISDILYGKIRYPSKEICGHVDKFMNKLKKMSAA